MGHTLEILPEPDAEVEGEGYWDESSEHVSLSVCFRCPFCSEPGQVSLGSEGSWPSVICEATARRFRVRSDVPKHTLES